MKDIRWIFNRLKGMNIKEIKWRITQGIFQRQEKKLIYHKHIPVYKVKLSPEISELEPSVNRMGFHWENTNFTIFSELNLFSKFSYDEFKKQWNAGFQTRNTWSEEKYSYDINYSQRMDIGDIRTNWELNRHFQFSALAKNYYVSDDFGYLKELKELFYDWNQHNLFLHGVEWASVMEIAIRVNSWIFTYCFLEGAFQKNEKERDSTLLDEVSHGILVMIQHIIKHRARFSSANNHLIVELYAVGMAGIFYNYMPWIELAIKTFTYELPRQNHLDGVNKEMSLHYQSFVMEAYGILMLTIKKNNIKIPKVWYEYLNRMSEFLSDSCGEYGETIVFGDNDEGKILDLNGKVFDYYRYVLDLMGCVLEKRYSKLELIHENISWLVSTQMIDKNRTKELYTSELVRHYKEGGYTILRSKDHKILIGIDHADLGFGKIAAHGHGDALSFQMFVEGKPIFVDPGTYNYHITPEARDYFRATVNHNTATVDYKEQFEMLGAFLWGKRAEIYYVECFMAEGIIHLQAEIGYNNIRHTRKFEFNFYDELIISDKIYCFNNKCVLRQLFVLGSNVKAERISNKEYLIVSDRDRVTLKCEDEAAFLESNGWYSETYNKKEKVLQLECKKKGIKEMNISTSIYFNT